MAAIRFTIAGLILLGFDLLRHPEARRMPTRRQLADSFLVGALLLGVGNGFVVFAQSLQVPSGVAAILTAIDPLLIALLAWLYLRQRLPRMVRRRDHDRLRGDRAAHLARGRGREPVRPAWDPVPAARDTRLGTRFDLLAGPGAAPVEAADRVRASRCSPAGR